jgi:L-asparaginase II
LRCVSDFSGVPIHEIAIGIDGCAAPNFALPVAAMARSFINLISPSRFPDVTKLACERIVSAMIKFPELIGGSTRLDTMLMRAASGKIISKVGADGVWLCGVLPSERWPTGLGIALKVEDGDDHKARPAIAVAVLRQLGLLQNTDLQDLSPMPIKNRRGETVGRIESTIKITI